MVSNLAVAKSAERGDPEAQFLLGEELAQAGQGEAAVAWLLRATRSGHAPSFALLGAWQVLGHLVARNVEQGMQRLEIAARHGEDAAAAFLSYAHASGLAGPPDWSAALDWLIAAARAGNARALAQVALLQPDGADPECCASLLAAAEQGGFVAARTLRRAGGSGEQRLLESLPWQSLRESIDVAALLDRPANAVSSFDTPAISTYAGFLDEDHRRYVMAVAAPGLERATVNEPRGGERVHEMRTNSSMAIAPTNADVLLHIISERLARLAGEPVRHGENINVLRYRPGEIYDDHYDFFDPAAPDFRHEIARYGQRTATALVYLNAEFMGGETAFPELGWRFRGRAGDAIVWRNVRPDGSPERRALHAGRPPLAGEKWVLSQWFRGQPQPPVR